MRRSLIAVMALLLISVFLLSGCTSTSQMLKEMPADFGFVFRYGVEARNELDTVNGSFTKDLVTAGTATTALKLSEEELTLIYYEMQKMNIMSYPEDYEPKTAALIQPEVTPYSTYYFKISYGGQTKEITWHDKNLSNLAGARDMRSLAATITNIVQSKAEYQSLPEPTGGYQ